MYEYVYLFSVGVGTRDIGHVRPLASQACECRRKTSPMYIQNLLYSHPGNNPSKVGTEALCREIYFTEKMIRSNRGLIT